MRDIKKWIEEIIQSEERYAIPIMTHPGIEIIGSTVKEAVQNGEIHARAIKALSDRFPSKASTVIMDLTVEVEAFGCQIDFPDHEMPRIIGRLVDSEGVAALQVPDLSAGRVPEFLKACRMAVEQITDKAVFAGVIGPFSMAGRLFDMSEIMVACYLEPDAIALLLEKCTQFMTAYCEALKATGCNGVVIAEPAAGLLSNDDCMQFSSAYIKQVIDRIQDDSFMCVLHNCGNTGHCTDAMLHTGAKAFHFGNAMTMTDALERCPADVLVMGNIDPVRVFKMMNPQQIKEQVTTLLTQTADYPNFVLSSGCDVPPAVPFENIQAFYDALSDYNATK